MADEEQIILIKKKSGHAGHHGGAWKVAYADFVTAMMSLFIVLWLMNSSKPIQTADGALSQVTSLLNRAVTLATEASSGGLSTGSNSQTSALNTEYQSILTEITQIGNTTNYNGTNVFTSNAPTTFTSTQASLTANTVLTTGSVTTINDSATGGTFIFKATAGETVTDLIDAVGLADAGTLSAGTTASLNGSGNLVIGPNTGTTGISVTSNDAVLGSFNASGGDNDNTVFISDGHTTGTANTTITTSINALSATSLALNATTLNSTAGSQSALTAVTAAIASVASQRGELGASVNRLQAASNVISTQVTNLQSATNNVDNADIGKSVADLTQYNILQSTGEAALQQANQAQQGVLKLLQ